KKADAFYSSARWRWLRREALDRDGWRCSACGTDISAPKAAQVDHVQEISAAPHLALELSNIRCLCRVCHNRTHSNLRSPSGQHTGERPQTFPLKGCDVHGVPYSRWAEWYGRPFDPKRDSVDGPDTR